MDLQTPYFLTPKTQPFFLGRGILPLAPFTAFMHPASAQLPALSGSPLGLPSNPRMPQLLRVYLQQGTFLDYCTGAHAHHSRTACARCCPPAARARSSCLRGLASTRSCAPRCRRTLCGCFRSSLRTMLVHVAEDKAVRAHDTRVLHVLLEDAGVDAGCPTRSTCSTARRARRRSSGSCSIRRRVLMMV
ncbi:hypothetical protein FA95DRAFT_303661 [Auriscalpium vulgare]|uniref:Uncharacterized protein n=1 Tax=Auriscalpium vulgare TaxID=40419 RepID=A0ACB8RJM1_9AGAM|nr:hypothetical protein FA95DRAFT_303661 [Auriscalpium vulgare]